MRPTAALVPLAVLLALSACSSSGSDDPQSLEARTTPTASAPVSAPTTAATRPARPPVGAAPGAAAPSTSTPSGSSGAAPSVAPLSTRAPGKPAAQEATAPGHYTYSSSGTVTFGTTRQDASGTQTLTISPLRGGIQHSTLHSDDSGDTEQDVVVRDTGSYGASLKLTSPAFSKEFRPAVPVLLVPDPAMIGKSWSWSATSTDGATHVTATNRLVRDETLTIGGTRVATTVLQTHLVLSGDLRYDATLTIHWAPAYRLPVKQRTVGKGSYSGIPFATDVTGVMRSVKPA